MGIIMKLLEPNNIYSNVYGERLDQNCKTIHSFIRVQLFKVLNEEVGNVTVIQNWEHIYYSLDG
jgi:hypothetical protein